MYKGLLTLIAIVGIVRASTPTSYVPRGQLSTAASRRRTVLLQSRLAMRVAKIDYISLLWRIFAKRRCDMVALRARNLTGIHKSRAVLLAGGFLYRVQTVRVAVGCERRPMKLGMMEVFTPGSYPFIPLSLP